MYQAVYVLIINNGPEIELYQAKEMIRWNH